MSWILVEKTLTALAMPTGLLWLGMMLLTVIAWWKKQRGLFRLSLVLLLCYTLAGNPELSKLWIGVLESRYEGIDPFDEGPFDAVIVLGGGTATAPAGRAQLAFSGDRVALGAQLYHAGRTTCLVTTGEPIAGLSAGSRTAAEETTEIWQRLAVPEDCIVHLPGRNTREEMRAIRGLVDEHPEWQRLGLVTSAWHMRRSMKLAAKHNLELTPLPADFRGIPVQISPPNLVPRAEGFLRTESAAKEILGALLGK